MENPPLLRKGSQGRYVALLQSLLSMPAPVGKPAPAFAVFDDATHDAVVRFQKQNQLMIDGIVGPQTWSALGVMVEQVLRPQDNGTVTPYRAVIRVPLKTSPRIYYVNGIQTDGATHAQTAYAISALTQRVVYGVFNATWSKGTIMGFGVDLGQCVTDWLVGVSSKLIEIRDAVVKGIAERVRKHFSKSPPAPSADTDSLIEQAIEFVPAGERWALCAAMFLTNRATAALYEQLRDNIGQQQYIVAHSQGNLITSNALWAMTMMHGPASLENMQVYSLASPAPAWPRGIRYKFRVYQHDNDLVTFANPHNWGIIKNALKYDRAVGQYDPYKNSSGMFDPHFVFNFGDKSFAQDIRRKLGLPEIQGWVFPK